MTRSVAPSISAGLIQAGYLRIMNTSDTPPSEAEALFAWIRERNEREYGTRRLETARRLGTELHPSATDVVAELVQNAEDCGATRMGFDVTDDQRYLLVWNNGARMTPRDVAAISGMLDSSKSEGSIGYFGIGFKSVLALTDSPQIISGDYRFVLEGCLDPTALPEEQTPASALARAADATVFVLPLRSGVGDEVIRNLRDRIQEDDMRLMFFLENLAEIVWDDEEGALVSRLIREQRDEAVSVLRTAPDDDTPGSWLLLRHRAKLTSEVADPIIRALTAAGSTRVQRVQESTGHELALKFAFDLEGIDGTGAVRAAETGLLASGLPTAERTGLSFHLEGWIPLSISRAQAKLEDPLAKWTLRQFEEAAVSLPHRLRHAGKWDAASIETVPLVDDVAAAFQGVATAFRDSVSEGEFFGDALGNLASRHDVAIAHRHELYSVLDQKDLAALRGTPVQWVAPQLRQGRCLEIARDLGVHEVSAADVIGWLTASFKEGQQIEPGRRAWFMRLLDYLRRLPPRDLAAIAIIPTTRGLRTPARSMLPPPDPASHDIDLLEQVPVVEQWLLDEPSGKAFVQSVQVPEFSYHHLLKTMALALADGTRPSIEGAGKLGALISSSLDRGSLSKDNVRELGEIAWLPCKGSMAKPKASVLGKTFGHPLGERYLRLVGHDGTLVRPGVADAMRKNGLKQAQIVEILTLLGCSTYVRPVAHRRKGPASTLRDHVKFCGISPPADANSSMHPWEFIEMSLPGLDDLLLRWEHTPPTFEESQAVFGALASCPRTKFVGTADELSVPLAVGEAALVYKYYSARHVTSRSFALTVLRQTSWLPDTSGALCKPHELVMPSVAEVFGGEMRSLNPMITDGASEESSGAIAALLDIQSDASVAAILHRLRALSAFGQPCPAALYRLLSTHVDRDPGIVSGLAAAFETETLLWSGAQGWRTADSVCWDDSSGLLPKLGEVWPVSLRAFMRRIGVADQPDPAIRARTLLHARSWTTAADRMLIQLVADLSRDFAQGKLPAELLEELRVTACWPGATSTGFQWFKAAHLVLDDDKRRGASLKTAAPMWSVTAGVELLRSLGAQSASDARPYLMEHGVAVDSDSHENLEDHLHEVREFAVCVIAQLAPPVAEQLAIVRAIRPVEGIAAGFAIGRYRGEADGLIRAWCASGEIRFEATRVTKFAHDLGDFLALSTGVPSLREFVKDLWAVDSEQARWDVANDYCVEYGLAAPASLEPFGGRDADAVASSQADAHTQGGLEEPQRYAEGELTQRIDPWQQVEPSLQPSTPTVPTAPTAPTGGSLTPSPPQRYTFDGRVSKPSTRAPTVGGGGFTSDVDSDWNAAIERVAVDWLTAELEQHGLNVTSVENQYVGYDLAVRLSDDALVMVEVKGRSSLRPTISLSRNEYETALAAAAANQTYLLVVVSVVDDTVAGAMVVDARSAGFAEVFVPSYLSAPSRWMQQASVFEAETFLEGR